MGTKFCSEKIPRNRLGTAVSVISRKKVTILRNSEVNGTAQNVAELREKN